MSSRRATATLVLALSTVGCGADRSVTTESTLDPAPLPNILLVSIDTLRADRLGTYGYPRATSPLLDAIAAEGTTFDRVYAPTPWTLPSHAAMLTGHHPWNLGFDSSWRTLPEEVPTIAELISARGYATAAFVDSSPAGLLGAERGFERGFDEYHHVAHVPQGPLQFDVGRTVDRTIDWLDRPRDQPFFLFVHTKSVHAVPNEADCRYPQCYPYDPPSPWREAFAPEGLDEFPWVSPTGKGGQGFLWELNATIHGGEPHELPSSAMETLEALYDGGILWVDHELGRLFDHLRRDGTLDETLVVITSDHGESFLEHNLLMHQELYDETLHVPLVVRPPTGLEHLADTEAPRSLMDVATTLVDAAGGATDRLSGQSLLGTADEADPMFAFYLFPSRFPYRAASVRQGPWKLIVHNPIEPEGRQVELYDLEQDPLEQMPVDAPKTQAELLQLLHERFGRAPDAQGRMIHGNGIDVSDWVKSLGYVE